MHQRLIETVGRLAGHAPSDLRVEDRPPLDHQSNRLYDAWVDGRRLLVKEYLKPEEFSTGPIREHRALELLAPFDVAPQPVGVVVEHGSDSGPLVVYEYLDGEMWDRRKPSEGELEALADIWLTVHTVSPTVDWEARGANRSMAVRYARFRDRLLAFREWTEAVFSSGSSAALRCLEVLDRRWPEVEELDALGQQAMRRCFCLTDTRFANVIQRPDGRLGLVDWEDSGLRDPAGEINDLMNHPNQEDLLSPEDWQAFLKPYLTIQAPRDPGLFRRAELYAANYPMFWLSVLCQEGLRRAEQGRLPGWTINGLPPNGRLRRYMARALAWPDPDFSQKLEEVDGLTFFPDA
jgi:aminoglycoside phosphotransferase (APT) family kinase protein